MKNRIYFISMIILCILVILLAGYIVYDKFIFEDIDDSSLMKESEDTEDNSNEVCTFIRTHHVVDLLEDYIGETSESTFVLVDHYQSHYPEVLHLPSDKKENLELNNNYEFVYTIPRDNNFDSEKEILDLIVSDYIANKESDIILVIRKTEKAGLELLNEDICK